MSQVDDEPARGRVFEVETVIFSNGDHAEVRWMVVVDPPRGSLGSIGVIQRSSTVLDTPGSDSEKESLPCFTKTGRWVFKYHRVVAWSLFEAAIKHRCGELPQDELTELLTAWEQW